MLRRSTVAVFALVAGACSSAAPAVDTPESSAPPRVLVNAMLFDVPASAGAAPFGSAASADRGATTGNFAATLSLYDLAARAEPRHVSAPTALAADGAVTRMSRPLAAAAPDDAVEAALATYRLDVTPHVDERGRVRLEVDLELAGKNAKTTVIVDDKQIVVLGPDFVVDDRRFVLLLRPNVVRSDAELEAIYADIVAQRDAHPRGR